MTEDKTDFEALHTAVVRRQAQGKIIWQPRIGCWLGDKQFRREKLPAPYEGMSKPEIYRELGCSARPYESFTGCFVRMEDPRVHIYDKQISETETAHIWETPVGKIYSVDKRTPSSPRAIKKKWLITSEEEMKVACWIEERVQWQFDQQLFEREREAWRGIAAPTVYLPRINIQHLYINVMGVEETTYALADYPQTVERYLSLLDESHERLIEVVNRCPIEIINFGDNLHCSTLSPRLFQKYVLPAYQRRNEMLHRAGKFTSAHWDGDTKALLPFAQECGLDGIEAITPQPMGDVTVEEIREALGDRMFLLDGIAAILFDEIFPVEALIEQTKKIIRLFAPNLILGISDEISSTGDIERIKIVGRIVKEYNDRVTEDANEKARF